MIDLIDNRTMLIVGCTALVLAGVIGVLSAIFVARHEQARRRQLVAVSEVTSDCIHSV
jgi:ABC-type spermidine/putrescine transport system permease subunit II